MCIRDRLRRFFTGVPTVIIEKGEIIEDNLRRVNFDLNDFLQECRSSGYFNIDDIYYAIMEANGRISFLPKAGSSPVTNENMNLKIKQEHLSKYRTAVINFAATALFLMHEEDAVLNLLKP